MEEWRTVINFPLYEVSNLGRVVNKETDVLIQPSLTLQGALKVGLYIGPKQYTRSVKRLVAEAFVPGRTVLFDTPVLRDGNQHNCNANNIVWRPRWFALTYARQFTNIPDHYRLGPIVELDHEGVVLGAYIDVVEIGVTHGLLFKGVWSGLHTRLPVFPTQQLFAFANKV
jgi:NUMOD4 motif